MSRFEKIIRVTIGFSFVLVVIGVFAGSFICNYLLRRSGTCTKGVLIDRKTGDRSTNSMLYYRVVINNKEYEGNSQETDLTRVGDSVCVVYLKSLPYFNRALKYFDPGEIKCNCGK